MSDKVWIISCACGWSRMVPRETPTEERRTLLTTHQREAHGITPDEGNEL
jgi:hypothetical protein